ncbi:MAG: NADPH-dependent F420 reductase [Solirubrobacterales bacterium]
MEASAAPGKAGASLTSPVAIVGGTGALGSALAARLAMAGVAVRVGSRTVETANESAGKIRSHLEDEGATVTGHLNTEAVSGCEIVFLTVPFRAQSENLNNLRNALVGGQILVDASVPLAAAISGKATRTIGVWQGSAAQQAAEMVPEGVVVVSALHSISAVTLRDLDRELDEDTLVMSDDEPAKAKVARLLELIPRVRAIDGGPLEQARIAEQVTALLIGVNIRYKTHAGVRFTDLPERKW